MNRRGFLNRFLAAATAALAAAVFYPVVRYLFVQVGPTAKSGPVVAAKVNEVPNNAFKIFPFEGEPAILIHLASGEYRAFSAVCTHLGCTVQYRADRPDIWCACHNGVYNLFGQNVSGPPPRPLEQYAVRIEGGNVIVDKKA